MVAHAPSALEPGTTAVPLRAPPRQGTPRSRIRGGRAPASGLPHPASPSLAPDQTAPHPWWVQPWKPPRAGSRPRQGVGSRGGPQPSQARSRAGGPAAGKLSPAWWHSWAASTGRCRGAATPSGSRGQGSHLGRAGHHHRDRSQREDRRGPSRVVHGTAGRGVGIEIDRSPPPRASAGNRQQEFILRPDRGIGRSSGRPRDRQRRRGTPVAPPSGLDSAAAFRTNSTSRPCGPSRRDSRPWPRRAGAQVPVARASVLQLPGLRAGCRDPEPGGVGGDQPVRRALRRDSGWREVRWRGRARAGIGRGAPSGVTEADGATYDADRVVAQLDPPVRRLAENDLLGERSR